MQDYANWTYVMINISNYRYRHSWTPLLSQMCKIDQNCFTVLGIIAVKQESSSVVQYAAKSYVYICRLCWVNFCLLSSSV